jgi:hypothetical protein
VLLSPHSGEADTIPGFTFSVSEVLDGDVIVGGQQRDIVVARFRNDGVKADTLRLPENQSVGATLRRPE